MNTLAALEKKVEMLEAEVVVLKAQVLPPAGVDHAYIRRIAEAVNRGDKGPLREHNRRVKAAAK